MIRPLGIAVDCITGFSHRIGYGSLHGLEATLDAIGMVVYSTLNVITLGRNQTFSDHSTERACRFSLHIQYMSRALLGEELREDSLRFETRLASMAVHKQRVAYLRNQTTTTGINPRHLLLEDRLFVSVFHCLSGGFWTSTIKSRCVSLGLGFGMAVAGIAQLALGLFALMIGWVFFGKWKWVNQCAISNLFQGSMFFYLLQSGIVGFFSPHRVRLLIQDYEFLDQRHLSDRNYARYVLATWSIRRQGCIEDLKGQGDIAPNYNCDLPG